MTLLRNGKVKKKKTYICKKPSPTKHDPKYSDEQSSFCLSVKGSPHLISFRKKILAGMTVEAAIVLPLCLFFLLNLGSVVEIIRLHNNLQLALWDTSGKVALYGYDRGGSTGASVLSAFYVSNRLVDNLGREYLDSSPLVRGSKGLQLLESEMLSEEDLLDITVTYAVEPFASLMGFQRFFMANRYYVHLWNGYKIPDTQEQTVLVYVAENGKVYHKTRSCTHLQLSVQQITGNMVQGERNQWGEKYNACEKCAKGEMPQCVYVTQQGTCYHYRGNCPGLKRTVVALTMEEAEGYRPCSRCGNQQEGE